MSQKSSNLQVTHSVPLVLNPDTLGNLVADIYRTISDVTVLNADGSRVQTVTVTNADELNVSAVASGRGCWLKFPHPRPANNNSEFVKLAA